jgi:hypothetical protein
METFDLGEDANFPFQFPDETDIEDEGSVDYQDELVGLMENLDITDAKFLEFSHPMFESKRRVGALLRARKTLFTSMSRKLVKEV